MADEIVNKVAASQLKTLDLEDYFPKEEIVVFDLKPYLFMEMVLKEKEFRSAMENLELNNYKDKLVTVTCITDAIIPVWAYMLVTAHLQPVAKDLFMGDEKETRAEIFRRNIQSIDPAKYNDQRVVIKGCGDYDIGVEPYLLITKILRPVAKSIMYGEPCSTVPVYKKK